MMSRPLFPVPVLYFSFLVPIHSPESNLYFPRVGHFIFGTSFPPHYTAGELILITMCRPHWARFRVQV